MVEKKNEIEEIIDTMITSGDDLVEHLKEILPDSLSETLVMFQESNVSMYQVLFEKNNAPVVFEHI